ncbi:acyl-CoA ligase (AMP-forming), exosortase A system-associated [Erythrobacter alti]|uniref:acyl-CoA ligase (AMP-forming), exosortase A system-associated n=1 Tax=Erythrobacter alti TaxID=1896145 RepID=UPI0030F3B1E1
MSATPDPVPRPLDHLAGFGADGDPALILRRETLSWKDLRSRVARLAAWLAQQVPEPGARVATWAAKGELTCIMPLAAARAGLVHVPLNPLLKHAQVRHILHDCSASLLIANSARLSALEDGDIPANCAVQEEQETYVLLESFEGALKPSAADSDDLAAILYTSGSTGRPKGVMLSHANLWLGAVSVAHYLGMEPDDVTLAVLPLSFDYGQNQLLSTWYAGGSVAPLDYLVPRDVIKACARHKVTTLAAVPPLWVQLTEQDWPEEVATQMRRMTNSGGALTTDLVSDLRRIFPDARLFPMYGLTEAFRSTYLEPDLVDIHPTSMGKAIPFAEILVVDTEGQIASEGELVHCGPLVAQGYWQDPQRTAERFKPAPDASRYGGAAVWSGDTVRRDEVGLLYFVGRDDAMIKSAGNRISPQEIEDAVVATGLADEAVAFGMPDERLGHAIYLIVRGKGDEAALREALRRDLPNFMQPAVIRIVDAMPLNPNGKIDRARLKQEAA